MKRLKIGYAQWCNMRAYIATMFACVFAHVATKLCNIDFAGVAKMPFQIAMMFAFILAHA